MQCIPRTAAAIFIATLCILAPAFAEEQEKPAAPSVADYDAVITKSDREHWAFQPVKRPEVPAVRDKGWVRNPIDAFILAKLEEKGWKASSAAKPQALLRRTYFDVIGLPPTPDEVGEFLKDASQTSLDRVAERLLAKPAYGERWGRHWLDLVRYAETNGYERDGAKPYVWRYRDYVIRSFNDDKPFDRFIVEQLAGDELPDANSDTVIALGYYRLGPWDDEPADPLEDRYDQLDDIVGTTSQVFLGLTLACARCHNHKFEPLTQLDYYRQVAVFAPLQRFQLSRFDLDAPAGNFEQLAKLSQRDKEIATLRGKIEELQGASLVEFLKSGKSKLPAEVIAAFQVKPADRNEVHKQLIAKHSRQLDEELALQLPEETRAKVGELTKQIDELQRATPDLPRAYFLHEPSSTPPATNVLLRGKPTRPGTASPPGMPTVLVSRQPEFLAATERTSQRRLTFARWLASPENPLTARVIVNRVWQFHFGEGLVRTASDFGVMGDPPTHPELLDWLADWFVREGWSIKKLHRLILTSNTYRMSKQAIPEYAAADPENRLWWRVPYRRLEVEAIRDAMLSVSGRLNPKMYGPSMYPFVPKEALAGSSDPDKIWPAFDEQEASRRTVYAFIKRSLVVPMIEVLDLCDTTRSSAKRAVTSVAPQALTLFNGHFVNQQAGHFAARLEREAGQDSEKQIRLAYMLSFSRDPTANEVRAMQDYLSAETRQFQEVAKDSKESLSPEAARRKALEQLCRVILNLNEFVYSD